MKLFILGILAAIIFLVLPFLFLYPRYLEASKMISDGDQFVGGGAYKHGLDQYLAAESKWPLLKYDQNLKNKISNAQTEIAKDPNMIAYFKDSVDQNNVSEITAELRNMPGIRDVKYVSKEDALAKYKEINKDSPALLQMVTADILPASLEVYLNDGAPTDQILSIIKAKSYVEDVIVTPIN